MTEAEWLACNDPGRMLDYLRGKASYRKFRLFVCAWCRLNWHQFPEQCRSAVEMGELFADGLVDYGEIKAAYWESYRVSHSKKHSTAMSHFAEIALTDDDEIWKFALYPAHRAKPKARIRQSALLRDLFGNPFRAVVIQPSWLAWNDGTVSRIAQAIYDDRVYNRLPILADALEDAGCDNADILRHCREPGEHVRGCWVVDLLLGKE